MSGGQDERDAIETSIHDAWIAGDWDTAIDHSAELTKFDKETGRQYARISEDHKNRRAPGLFGPKRSAS